VHATSLPEAQRLRDLLRSEIVHGAYADGMLPGEAELMAAHQTSRATVREALALLREEGVIARRQGVGTVVLSHALPTSLSQVHGVERPAGKAPLSVDDVETQVLDSSMIETSVPVARLLDTSVGEPCARIEYLVSSRSAGGLVAVCTNYVLLPEAEALLATRLSGNWYSYLDAAGVQFGEDDFLIGALVAGQALADRLGVTRGDPLLHLEQVIRDRRGRPFNAAYIYLRADRIALVSRASLAPADGGGQ
jgi:GntR family transcriptional regulator